MARKPFKKDLTPIGKKGTVSTHAGKGAAEQRTRPGQRESLTGDNMLGRLMGEYPKPVPAPLAPAAPPPGISPMGPPKPIV